MKFTLFLNGLLLLFLLPNWSVEENVDINTLGRIVHFFEQNYKREGNNNSPRQYAVAINVLKQQCQQGFNPAQNNFLTHEIPANVKAAISNDTNAIYNGTELIAAGTRKIKKNHYLHSESLLMNPANNSFMSRLLNQMQNSCSILYTFNSPCMSTCLNTSRNNNIINALSTWKDHIGIKAFVFSNFWRVDINRTEDIKNKFKQIVNNIPLYRCVSENECYACGGEGNTSLSEQCLPSRENNH